MLCKNLREFLLVHKILITRFSTGQNTVFSHQRNNTICYPIELTTWDDNWLVTLVGNMAEGFHTLILPWYPLPFFVNCWSWPHGCRPAGCRPPIWAEKHTGKKIAMPGFRKMRRVKSVEPVVSLSCLPNMSHEQHRQDQVTSTGTWEVWSKQTS